MRIKKKLISNNSEGTEVSSREETQRSSDSLMLSLTQTALAPSVTGLVTLSKLGLLGVVLTAGDAVHQHLLTLSQSPLWS